MPIRYLAIEGVPGVGKTRLARLLGDRFNARLILEVPEENPFLPLYYEDPARYAFQAQVFYLLSRFRQQQEVHQLDLFQSMAVSNYLFLRDRVYASLTLNDDELALYEHLVDAVSETVPRPDLVIYLQNSAENVMRAIRRRDRGYERVMTEEYLARLIDAYNQFFFHYTQTPLLVVQSANLDFVHRPDDLEALMDQLDSPPAGTRHYSPMQVGL